MSSMGCHAHKARALLTGSDLLDQGMALVHHHRRWRHLHARRCIFETMPGGFDLGLCGALASGPRLGGGGCVLGEVVPDDGAGNAMEEA